MDRAWIKKDRAAEALCLLGAALLCLFVIRSFLFTVARVEGDSMARTLENGDRLLVTVIDLKLTGPKRGDVVTCRYPGRFDLYVKRVVGLEGDVVELRRGRLFVNGERVVEPYVTHSLRSYFGPVKVGEGHVFVLGDNRADSLDSRDVGQLSIGQLAGRVRRVLWPLDRSHPV